MLPEDTENYLSEIARTLAPGGRCFFATFFILDEESSRLQNKSEQPFFPYDYDHYLLHHQKVKTANVAFREDYLQRISDDAGLQIRQRFDGWWPGRKKDETLDFQDIIIFDKPS